MPHISRRQFLCAGTALSLGAATAFYPKITQSKEYWLVSACTNKHNEHFVAAIDLQGRLKSKVKLPARGHDVIPLANKSGHAIIFARRPGTFALEVDLINGKITQEINAAIDSHFYGHGIVSNQHKLLITSENHFSTGEGRIVLRNSDNYQIVATYPSGGIGPHQIALMPSENILVIANGGIKTHPDQPRKKLNLETMKPNLAYLDLSTGEILKRFTLDNHQLSIRHLAVSKQGKVIAGLQYQGAKNDLVPLIVSQQGEGKLQYLSATDDVWRRMNQYTASVCLDEDNQIAVVSCPRANIMTYWSLKHDTYMGYEKLTDGAGLTFANTMYFTSGKGRVVTSKILNTHNAKPLSAEFSDLKWDNHLGHIMVS